MTSTMPHIPNAFERQHRRYSSGAGALVSPTLAGFTKASDPERPSSSGKLLSRVQDVQHAPLSKHDISVNSRALEDGPLAGDVNEGVGNLNRWSSSTASSVSTHNRRHSSFSRRFSLSGSSFNPGFRALSPTKRRRSSEAQRDPPTATSTPTSLPSLNRFSPLTVPNLSFSSSKDDHNTDKPLPPRPAAAVEQPAIERKMNDTQQQRAFSPSKRLREPLIRAGSNLSDIQEGSRATTPIPRDQDVGIGIQLNAPLSKHLVRPGPSREPSPMKHDRQRASGDIDSAGVGSLGDAPPSTNAGGPANRAPGKDKDKKMMLTKALQRANEAVQLDNQQAYTKAMAAYEEACELLDSVMARTTAEYDRQKLTAIRGTYLTRIEELERLMKPKRKHSHQVSITPSLDEALDEELAAESVAAGFADPGLSSSQQSRQTSNQSTGPRAGSAMSKSSTSNSRPNEIDHLRKPSTGQASMLRPGSSSRDAHTETGPFVTPPGLLARQSAVPRPLLPNRSKVPGMTRSHSADRTDNGDGGGMRPESDIMDDSASQTGSTSSWFHIHDERDSAPASPVSHGGSMMVDDPGDHKYHNAEPETTFDDAFDAAIESAYDDGFESYDPAEYEAELTHKATRNDPLEDQARFYEQRQMRIQRLSQRARVQQDGNPSAGLSDNDDGLDTDEEDRLLAEGDQTIGSSAAVTEASDVHVPRKSDSSGFSGHSGRTWGSSAASSLNTTGTSLGTVDENALLAASEFKPRQAFPAGPSSVTSSSTTPTALDVSFRKGQLPLDAEGRSRSRSPNLRDRRVSPHKVRKLRIETGVSGTSPERRPSGDNDDETMKFIRRNQSGNTQAIPPRKPSAEASGEVPTKTTQNLDPGQSSSQQPSPLTAAYKQDVLTPPTPSVPRQLPGQSAGPSPLHTSPEKSNYVQLSKQPSSVSLNKDNTERTPEGMAPWPNTPASFGLPYGQTPGLQRSESAMDLPVRTPIEGSFGSFPTAHFMTGTMFNNEIHTATLTGDPSKADPSDPPMLEPCPTNDLLGPWWVLRGVFRSIDHPEGGYITNKLFMPREAWTVKTAKLKGVEEKISACDLLTAALLKLSHVDTLDAGAVLHEMKSLEVVLENAQKILAKKLGNDVGLKGLPTLIKDAPPKAGSPDTATPGDDSTNTGNRGFNWRKLRSKSSSTNLANSNRTAATRGSRRYTLGSVPMADHLRQRLTRRPSRRDTGSSASLRIDGSNANYVGALYRLTEAAQVLGKLPSAPSRPWNILNLAVDEITRQVIDKGLRAKSETYVELELCLRHAVEFFGLYVVQFILRDIEILQNKRLKNASNFILESLKE